MSPLMSNPSSFKFSYVSLPFDKVGTNFFTKSSPVKL